MKHPNYELTVKGPMKVNHEKLCNDLVKAGVDKDKIDSLTAFLEVCGSN